MSDEDELDSMFIDQIQDEDELEQQIIKEVNIFLQGRKGIRSKDLGTRNNSFTKSTTKNQV
jgi:hypothetical protein